ncbi:uncharacterized protein L3040_001201 [Drepanopeziza brunnea f. sp. 'multigermtubi']|uniref:uncharacterized protein n=1 Tax=Drepanopeziza brunnea f. sp. 'multigermtubi' TaxID=698441 RepID=UPI00238B16E2|nr:hypothetical protein L3040_001201 [Drepanopeziza brunnea f. sp. 'multigermtubi']
MQLRVAPLTLYLLLAKPEGGSKVQSSTLNPLGPSLPSGDNYYYYAWELGKYNGKTRIAMIWTVDYLHLTLHLNLG